MKQLDEAFDRLLGHPRTEEQLRIYGWSSIPAGTDNYASYTEFLPEELRSTDGFGVCWAASRFSAAALFTSPAVADDHIAAMRRGESRNLNVDTDVEGGLDVWPTWGPWERAIPDKPSWTKDNEGIIAERDGVVVYETHYTSPFVEDASPRPIVTWHCQICHASGKGEEYVYQTAGERHTIGYEAGRHLVKGHKFTASAVTIPEAVAEFVTRKTGRYMDPAVLMQCKVCPNVEALRALQ
ncbi:hypothetical protein AB0I28_32015 [Phytomonospora sp. NPDC050363]|uniref:hypothetical protein n=1 Tax=Phytomonospora sp. NPDC050363 TaxID=3155642 RepID=UPI0033E2719E